MKQSDYYRGHLITFDGKWYIAHHGETTLRALSRQGIELLIFSVMADKSSMFDLADYHIGRCIELITSELGKNPTGEDENTLLIQLKRTHALLLKVWTQLK